MNPTGHFYSISGFLPFTRVAMMDHLKQVLPQNHPDTEFVFIDSPFERVPHRLLVLDMGRTVNPLERLMTFWAHLGSALTRTKTAIEEGKIVVINGFELDAWLYAVGDENDQVFAELADEHHHLIDVMVRRNGIPAPIHLLVSSDDDQELIRSLQVTPLFQAINPLVLQKFVDRMRLAITDHFRPQRCLPDPVPLNASELGEITLYDRAAMAIGAAITAKRAVPDLKVA